jgi:hypothetical protein
MKRQGDGGDDGLGCPGPGRADHPLWFGGAGLAPGRPQPARRRPGPRHRPPLLVQARPLSG